MNNESLDEVKKLVTHKYLGKAGIYAVGISRLQNAICVYIEADSSTEQKILLKHIEKDSTPFKVLIIEEERPMILRQENVE
jgi:hypothetical protein